MFIIFILSCHLSPVIPVIGWLRLLYIYIFIGMPFIAGDSSDWFWGTSHFTSDSGGRHFYIGIFRLVPYTTSVSGGWAAYEVFVSDISVISKSSLMIFATLPFIFRMFVWSMCISDFVFLCTVDSHLPVRSPMRSDRHYGRCFSAWIQSQSKPYQRRSPMRSDHHSNEYFQYIVMTILRGDFYIEKLSPMFSTHVQCVHNKHGK